MAITPRHRLDVFLARNAEAGTGLTPLLAFIHGGFWHSHDKSEFSFIAAPFVHAGITVALINYPLAPSVPLDEIVRSVGRAFNWLHDRAPQLNVDSRRIVAAGHSAGAHLAVSALVSPVAACADVIAGAVAVSGIYDLAPLLRSPVNTHIGLTAADALAHNRMRQVAARACQARLMLAVGTAETPAFIAQTRSFAGSWRLAGGAVDDIDVPEANHYSIMLDLAEPSGRLCQAVLRFIRSL